MQTLEQAVQARDVGMMRAQIGAENAAPGWGERAYEFLYNVARWNETFSPEAVTDAYNEWLEAPSNPKAWGPVYLRAVRAGIIERSTETYRRRYGHGSLGVLWRSKVFYPREQGALL